jgi:hypothetical protein
MNDPSAVIADIQRNIPKSIHRFNFVAMLIARVKSMATRRVSADANPGVDMASFVHNVVFFHVSDITILSLSRELASFMKLWSGF